MDLTGPLPATNKGFQYILTATDYLTKLVEAFPVKHKSAHEVAKKICKIISQFGCLQQTLTDRGSEFNNEMTCF